MVKSLTMAVYLIICFNETKFDIQKSNIHLQKQACNKLTKAPDIVF